MIEFSVSGDDPVVVEQVRAVFVAVLDAMSLSHEESSPPPPAHASTVTVPGEHPLVGLSTQEIRSLRAYIERDQGSELPISHLTWRAQNKPDEIRYYLSAMRRAEENRVDLMAHESRKREAEEFSEIHGYAALNEDGDRGDDLRAMRVKLLDGEVTLAEALAEYLPPERSPEEAAAISASNAEWVEYDRQVAAREARSHRPGYVEYGEPLRKPKVI